MVFGTIASLNRQLRRLREARTNWNAARAYTRMTVKDGYPSTDVLAAKRRQITELHEMMQASHCIAADCSTMIERLDREINEALGGKR
jgi:hypothetical protein